MENIVAEDIILADTPIGGAITGGTPPEDTLTGGTIIETPIPKAATDTPFAIGATPVGYLVSLLAASFSFMPRSGFDVVGERLGAGPRLPPSFQSF